MERSVSLDIFVVVICLNELIFEYIYPRIKLCVIVIMVYDVDVKLKNSHCPVFNVITTNEILVLGDLEDFKA